ncbi:MAG: hypothetical protein ACREKL_10305 [Chthoniobacterales bacterium]
MFIAGRVFGIFALTLAFTCSGALAFSQSDRDVQTLGNFLALQKIASKDDSTLRDFVKRVSAVYTKAGYNDFGPEFRHSGGAVIAQFAIGAGDDDLRKARMALRKLEQALEKDAFVVLPASAGKSLPDYYGLANAFVEGAKVGLKNVTLGKNVTNTLRNKKPTLWLINNGNGNYTFLDSSRGGLNGATLDLGSGDSAYFGDISGAGTLTLSGATSINAGTFRGGGLALGDMSYAITLTDPNASPTSLGVSSTLNVLDNRTVNAGTVGIIRIGTGTLDHTETITLTAGNLTIQGSSGLAWAAFPIDPAIYGSIHKIVLGNPYTVNGVDFPAGTYIYQLGNYYASAVDVEPIVLPGTNFVATPTVSPTPTP